MSTTALDRPSRSSSSASASSTARARERAASRAPSAFARAAASSFSRQQRLYFLPLPQGQGAFRPVWAMMAVASSTEKETLVPSAAAGCEILRVSVESRPPAAGRGAGGGLRALRRPPSLRAIPPQAARWAGRARRGRRQAVQPVLCAGGLPGTLHAAVAALSRAQGLPGRRRGGRLGDASWRDAGEDAEAPRSARREQANRRALADVVAQGVRREPVLADHRGRVHAAGADRALAGVAPRALFRRRRGSSRGASAPPRPDHRPRGPCARSLRAAADPQRTPVDSRPATRYGARSFNVGSAVGPEVEYLPSTSPGPTRAS